MAGGFGDLISRARGIKKITLRKLSELVGLSASFLSEIEHGRRMPPKDEDRIRNLSLVLDIDEDELIEAARRERLKKRPKFFDKLFETDKELAWGFYRAAEEATEDDLQEAFRKALKSLEKEE